MAEGRTDSSLFPLSSSVIASAFHPPQAVVVFISGVNRRIANGKYVSAERWRNFRGSARYASIIAEVCLSNREFWAQLGSMSLIPVLRGVNREWNANTLIREAGLGALGTMNLSRTEAMRMFGLSERMSRKIPVPELINDLPNYGKYIYAADAFKVAVVQNQNRLKIDHAQRIFRDRKRKRDESARINRNRFVQMERERTITETLTSEGIPTDGFHMYNLSDFRESGGDIQAFMPDVRKMHFMCTFHRLTMERYRREFKKSRGTGHGSTAYARNKLDGELSGIDFRLPWGQIPKPVLKHSMNTRSQTGSPEEPVVPLLNVAVADPAPTELVQDAVMADPGSALVDLGSDSVDPGSGSVDPGSGSVDPGSALLNLSSDPAETDLNLHFDDEYFVDPDSPGRMFDDFYPADYVPRSPLGEPPSGGFGGF